MTKHSTLLYWVDEFDESFNLINYPVIIEENLLDEYLNNVFQTLEYDPGDDLVKKTLSKIS